MKKNKSLLLSVIALAAVILTAAILYPKLSEKYGEASSPEELLASKKSGNAPDFTVYTEDGTPVRLSERLTEREGRPCVLNFWATWCPYCVEELPIFEKYAALYDGKVDFYMIDLADGRDTVEKALAYMEENGYTFPVYFDTDGNAAIAYGASAIPLTAFIDADGNLYALKSGAIREETAESILKKLTGAE